MIIDLTPTRTNTGTSRDQCRQRLQQDALGHRGRSGDPLYGIRRLARTRARLLTIKQWFRLLHMFRDNCHAPLEITWEAYQRVIDAYQAPDPTEGKQIMEALIDAINSAVPQGWRNCAPSAARCSGAETTCSRSSNTRTRATAPPRPSNADIGI